jgi:hypothetical protein
MARPQGPIRLSPGARRSAATNWPHMEAWAEGIALELEAASRPAATLA